MTTTHNGNWTDLRNEFGLTRDDEIDLHFGRRDPHVRYDDVMADVARLVESKLIEAQKNKRPYLLFVHGRSTSRSGKISARSIVRAFMRSKKASPLIERAGCIQHETVYLAKIRLMSEELVRQRRKHP